LDRTHDNFGNGTESLDAMESARRYNAAIEDEVVRALGAPLVTPRVLDIGAGGGEFASRIMARGYEVTCVEPDDLQRQALAGKGLSAFASLDAVQGPFDGAYMINVLEHIQDDVAILREIHDLLAPDAPLFVWVPAFEALYSDFDFALGHFRRYTRDGLRRSMTLGGFDVQKTAYRDSLGWFAAFAWKVAPKRDRSAVSGGAVGAYDKWVFPASQLLDKAASRGFGKNVIATARRRGVTTGRAPS
jgi:SAM-dependent methyltransferase